MIQSATSTIRWNTATMPTRETNPDWLDPDEAADLLKVARATFYRMIRRGDLAGVREYRPSTRRGRFSPVYYNRADLMKWMEERQTELPGSGSEGDPQ